MTLTDDVVLVAEDGRAIGTAPKAGVHTDATPLHLAFSCHAVNAAGQVLVTRRALGKATWPGVWTNSFCGHPRPGEPIADAVRRHANTELGLMLDGIEVALPEFRYRAVDASGVVENEICPVYLARVSNDPSANPGEVVEWRWTEPAALADAVAAAPWAFSPWLVLQVAELPLYRGVPTLQGRRSA